LQRASVVKSEKVGDIMRAFILMESASFLVCRLLRPVSIAKLLSLCALAFSSLTWAQSQDTYPNQAIRLIVAFSPGTSSDALARMLSQGLAQELGQPVVVENRPGAGGIVGTEFVASSAPDGYTLTLATTSTMMTSPMLNSNAKYSAEKNFSGVIGLAKSHFIIATRNDPTYPQTLQELVQRLKKGNGSYASSGVATVIHLTASLFIDAAGVTATHVPYPGSGQALTDVAAGHVLFSSETNAATIPLAKSGKIKALAVTSAQRSPAIPEVPTVRESGYPDFVVSSWFGLMAPKGTPAPVLQKLANATRKVMSTPKMIESLQSLAFDPLDLSLGDFDQFIAKEAPFWADTLKRANLKAE
jgi:tripartite-type tricarboxylate transporter receptor subunit TctC